MTGPQPGSLVPPAKLTLPGGEGKVPEVPFARLPRIDRLKVAGKYDVTEEDASDDENGNSDSEGDGEDKEGSKTKDPVKKELKEKKGVEVENVLMMSDEKSERWWREVAELGWYRLDHEMLGTEARYGEWYPVFIDAVAQSLGIGFVGTQQSTMSLVDARRVMDWNNGIVRYVNRWNSEL